MCHLMLLVLGALKPWRPKNIIETELDAFGIRLNSKPFYIGFQKMEKGSITLKATCCQSEPGAETVKSILLLLLLLLLSRFSRVRLCATP